MAIHFSNRHFEHSFPVGAERLTRANETIANIMCVPEMRAVQLIKVFGK